MWGNDIDEMWGKQDNEWITTVVCEILQTSRLKKGGKPHSQMTYIDMFIYMQIEEGIKMIHN